MPRRTARREALVLLKTVVGPSSCFAAIEAPGRRGRRTYAHSSASDGVQDGMRCIQFVVISYWMSERR
jgi:hypothetical protein